MPSDDDDNDNDDDNDHDDDADDGVLLNSKYCIELNWILFAVWIVYTVTKLAFTVGREQSLAMVVGCCWL